MSGFDSTRHRQTATRLVVRRAHCMLHLCHTFPLDPSAPVVARGRMRIVEIQLVDLGVLDEIALVGDRVRAAVAVVVPTDARALGEELRVLHHLQAQALRLGLPNRRITREQGAHQGPVSFIPGPEDGDVVRVLNICWTRQAACNIRTISPGSMRILGWVMYAGEREQAPFPSIV